MVELVFFWSEKIRSLFTVGFREVGLGLGVSGNGIEIRGEGIRLVFIVYF